jgi:phage repressor protein C with HTH and peptisase S24 domain
MLSHAQVWNAVDALAARYGLSASGLAKKAGLDATTFNRSKRTTGDGRQRWPSTESIAKVLEATGASIDDFMGLLNGFTTPPALRARPMPLIGFAQAGNGGFFDDGGYPAGAGWDEVNFPAIDDTHAYALEVSGESMMPAYRDGDRIIVSPEAPVRRGDRVVVRTRDGEIMAKELKRQTARQIELRSLNPEHEDRTLQLEDIEWMGRIIWASQ